jgi:cytochrome c-type biogenesis protein CcmH/NrfG
MKIRCAIVLLMLATLAGCALHPTAPLPPISDKQAVVPLVEGALIERDAGRLDQAVIRLERALHLEPRNGMIWHYLAAVRFQQGELDKAETLATRANSFAGDSRALRAANWRMIGEIRSTRADAEGAKAAFDKASEFEH